MKKSLQLLASAALFAAGALNASADRYHETTDAVDVYSGVQEGVQYALQMGSSEAGGTYGFLNGQSFTTNTHLTAGNLYTFVKVGSTTDDGYEVYYIKNSAGEYLYAPGQTNWTGASENRAWKVAIKPIAVYTSDYEYSDDDDNDYTGIEAYAKEALDGGDEFDYSTATYVDVENGCVIVSAEDATSSACTFLLGGTSVASRGTNYNYNTWVIYEVHQMTALDYLDAVLLELFPDGFDPDNYEVGIDPGQYSAEALEALTAAYEAATGDVTEANAEALADALLKAWEDFKASFVNFGEGYYIFTTYRSATGALFDNTDNVSGATSNLYTYTNPAVAITHTQNGTEYSIGDWDVYDPDNDEAWIGTAAAPYFIWHVTKSDTPGMYYVQNWKTGRYIGTPGASKASNTPIPMVDEPNATFNMAPSANYAGYWKFYSDELTKNSAWGGSWEMGGLHAPGDVLNMVTWNSETDGSLWYPRTVTDEMLETIKELGEQPALNQELKNLVNNVRSTIEDNINYALAMDGKNIAEAEAVAAWLNMAEVDGLVTDADQLNSNATEPTEGSLDELLDSDLSTYFHSMWSTGPDTDEDGNYAVHDLEIDLRNTYDAVTIKFTSRPGSWGNGHPSYVVVYGSNDGENWTRVTAENDSVLVNWYTVDQATVNGETASSSTYAGWFTTPLGYSHLRFDVVHTHADKGSYGKYFYLSELRAYEAKDWAIVEDPNSPYYLAPKEIRDKVDALLEQADAELEDALATRGTIDALQAAYDELKAAMPNVEQLTDLIAEAQAIHDGAQAGTKPGYFTQEAIDALQKAIDAANAAKRADMSVEEVKAAVAALNAALAAFDAALIKPADGVYMIKSTSGTASNYATAMYTQDSSRKYSVAKGGRTYDKEAKVYKDDATFADRLGAYWQVAKSGEGYTIKNLYTGLYLAPVGNESQYVSQSEAPYVFGLQFAKMAGSFNIVIAEEDAYNGTYLYVNAQPGGGVVTWSAAGEFVTDDETGAVLGTDNSGWEFVPQEGDVYTDIYNAGMVYDLEVANAPQLVTFPVDVDAVFTEDAKFYTVIGQDASNNIQLEEADDVKAGQAYVLVPVAEEASAVRVYFKAETLDALNPTCKAGEAVNGLTPVFEWTKVAEGCGIFNTTNTLVLVAEEGDQVAANTGFFGAIPATSKTGDAQLAAEGRIAAEGVSTIVMNNADNKIYNLSGVRVNSVKNLPAGLYIINGKKYIVK